MVKNKKEKGGYIMENKRYILQELYDSGFCYYGILDTKTMEIVYTANNYTDTLVKLTELGDNHA